MSIVLPDDSEENGYIFHNGCLTLRENGIWSITHLVAALVPFSFLSYILLMLPTTMITKRHVHSLLSFPANIQPLSIIINTGQI